MSSHFNYEIDERNLRAKLKGMDFPVKENLWVQFDMYCDSCKSNYKTSSMPRFQLNINRNVVLPIVFGGVIILFSLLLFNFVSIKNKATDKSETKLVLQEPKKDVPVKSIVAPPIEKKMDTVLVGTVDSTQIKLAAVPQPSITETKTVSVPANTVAAVTIPTVSVTETDQKTSDADGWTTNESAEIYVKPNNKSEVIGTAAAYRTYQALEETNYFIKVNFQVNGAIQEGYIGKIKLRKNNGQAQNHTGKKISRKAEEIESKAPTSIPTSAEPELR